MEILQLKYFVALAHQEHLTNTAKEMMVTPSAIRISISHLEEKLGVKLFDKVGRNIYLNEYGKTYLQYAESALNSLEDGLLHLREMKQSTAFNITLGVWNPQSWHGPIKALRTLHPEISINQVVYDPVASDFDPMQKGIDIFIASPEDVTAPNWVGAPLFEDRIFLAVPPQHPFAGRESIDLSEARNDNFIVSAPEDSFARLCERLCAQAGFSMRAPIKCDYTLRPKIMLSENMVCMVTWQGAASGNYSAAKLVKINSPSDRRPRYIYWRKGRYLSEGARIARDFFIEYFQDFQIDC